MDEIDIVLPSGAPFTVLGETEAVYLERLADAYQEQFEFTNISDLAELDRLLAMELLSHRYTIWLAKGVDYDNEPVPVSLSTRLKDQSIEIRQIKKQLGIDKISRDRARGEGSTAQYLANVRQRAGVFGIFRNEQAARSIELINELIGMVQFNKQANEKELRKFGLTDEGIKDWIWDTLRPEYEELDAAFREREQKMWIREM